MLTILSTPKPFVGHIGLIQRNAIGSWVRLSPRPQIILFGDSAGVHEVAAEFGLEHVPSVDANEFGTPYLRALLQQASPPLVLDLRYRRELLEDPHTLPGALHVSPAELPRRHREIPRDRDLVLYCS